MSFLDLVVFRACIEKFAVILMGILMGISLSVTCIFFLCNVECFDYDTSGGCFFFISDSLMFCKLLVPK
jgi:hypothetical protein